MNFFKVEITEENHKKRLDKALAELASDYSRNRLQSLIKGGQVQVNKNIVKDISYKISTGDEIEFNIDDNVQGTSAGMIAITERFIASNKLKATRLFGSSCDNMAAIICEL